MMRRFFCHRHLSLLTVGVVLCVGFSAPPKADAAASFTVTPSVFINASTVGGTFKQIRFTSDGNVIIQGSSRTTLGKMNATYDSVSTLNYSPAMPCANVSSFVLTGSTMYSTCAASTAVPQHQISGTSVIGTATGSVATSAGATDIAMMPDGRLLVNKGSTLYLLNKDLTTAQTFTMSGAAVRLAADASHNVFYVTSTGTLRKYNLDTRIDTIIKSYSASPKGLWAAANGTTYFLGASGGLNKATSTGTLLWTTAFSSPASLDIDNNGKIILMNTSGIFSIYSPIGQFAAASATASGTSVQLDWNTNVTDSDFAGVTIRRSTTSFPTSATDGTPVTIDNMGNTFTDTGLTPNTTYYYTFFKRTLDGYYSDGLTESVTVDPNPGPVTGLTATASGNDIVLDWTNPADADFSSIMIRRSTVGPITGTGAGSIIAPEMNIHHFVDSDRDDGTYYYGIFAKDAGGHYSTVATANATIDTIAPSAPNLLATVVGSNVQLSWDTPATTAYYMIRRSTSSYPASDSDGSLVLITSADITSTIDFSLADGTYYYSIFAYDDVGNRSNAGQATATLATASSSSSSSGSASSTPTYTPSHGGSRGRSTSPPKPIITVTHPAAPTNPPEPTKPNQPSLPKVSDNMQKRTCARVKKMNITSSSVLQRLNARLDKDFGFSCGT